MSGWIKIHRKIETHWVYKNSQYFHWWIDILLSANYEPKKVLVKGKLLQCNAGETLYSFDTWAKRWNVNKSAARRFLQLLENDEMIVLKNETVTTRLTVCNYESYQDIRNADETQVKRKRNASETQTTPTKEIEEDKEIKEEDISFETFWDLYQKKVDRSKAEKLWAKIKPELHQTIFRHVEQYVISTPDVQYRKNPTTYLNSKSWENEIIQSHTSQPKQPQKGWWLLKELDSNGNVIEVTEYSEQKYAEGALKSFSEHFPKRRWIVEFDENFKSRLEGLVL